MREDYIRELNELKELREKLTSVEDTNDTRENTNEIKKYMLNELVAIDDEIKSIEINRKNTAKEYERFHKEFQQIVVTNEKELDGDTLLSDQEINAKREAYEKIKLDLNAKSLEIKERFDKQTKLIKNLKTKKTRLETSINMAEALGLTYSEYKDIISTIRNKSIMSKILDKKGLTDIIEKPEKQRTKEEKALLNKAKKDILTEISELKKNNQDISALDAIEAIYSTDEKYIKEKEPVPTQIKGKELMVISQNRQLLPYKVMNNGIKTSITTTLEEAPKDMEGATTNTKVDISELKPAEEKVTIFKANDSNEYYVRRYAIERLRLRSANLADEVKIDGNTVYKISEYDVEKIKGNANNSNSPYIVNIKVIGEEKKIELETTPTTEVVTEPETTPITEVETTPATEVVTEPETIPTTEVVTEPETTPTTEVISQDDNKENIKPQPKNIRASQKFKLELKEGTIAYNIVHKVPIIVKRIFGKAIEKVGEFFEKAEDISRTIEEYISPTVDTTKIYADDLPRYTR